MEIKSSLYRELSESELQQVISTALHTTFTDYRLLTGGLFNTTYFVDTVDCGKVVVRMGPVNRHLLMPFEHQLMRTEAMFYDLCRAGGVPVSEVLFLSTDKSILDRDIMIVRYIPSKNFYDIHAEGELHTQLFGFKGFCRFYGTLYNFKRGVIATHYVYCYSHFSLK